MTWAVVVPADEVWADLRDILITADGQPVLTTEDGPVAVTPVQPWSPDAATPETWSPAV